MSTEGNPVAGFISWVLIIVGALIALLSGGCTVIFFGFLAGDIAKGSSGENLSITIMALLFGGVPFAVGLVLLWAGRQMRKPRITPPPGDAA